MPYVREILKNTRDSHQTSGAYVLTFVRWQNRDTINYNLPELGVRQPFVVINDAVNIQLSDSKSGVTGSANIILKAGDINYATTMAPGDFVFINLVGSDFEAEELAKIAGAGNQINKYNQGFKGMYKIQKIRRQVVVDPQSGTKNYQFVIHAFSFTELKTVIYYNPTAARSFSESRTLFLSQFADWWSNNATDRKGNLKNVQGILVKLVKALLGNGLRNRSSKLAADATSNDQFFVPTMVGRLLGIKKKGNLTIPDIYNFIFGVWDDVSSGSQTRNSNIPFGQGFNPNIKKISGDETFYEVKGGRKLEGWRLLAATDFNYKEIWSIIQSYMNAGINEAYTCMRISPDTENPGVYPTVIIRQKPFTSEHFKSPNKVNGKKSGKGEDIKHTKYSSLPRWKIHPDLIYSVDLGKDEIARVNYVQFYGRSISANRGYNEALQAENIYYDKDDIKRHGLKPAIITTNCDFPLQRGDAYSSAKKWAWLMFDMLNAGQNRESGTITCQGILEPICVGDNLEFDNAIYHIEAVSHVMSIDTEGRKTFRTTLMVSFGTSLDSNKQVPVYPQQDNTYSELERERDYGQERILPGLSDTQFLPNAEGKSRIRGELIRKTEERQEAQTSFTGGPVKQTGPNRASKVKTTFSKKGQKILDEHREKTDSQKKKD